jgi:excinuclease ABC subunit B
VVQAAYNQEHGITPASIVKAIETGLTNLYDRDYGVPALVDEREEVLSQDQLESRIEDLQAQMRHAAANLDFERAARLRDKIKLMKGRELGVVAARPTRS